MKTDKILFGAACLGMGLLIHTEINRQNREPFVQRPVVSETASAMRPALEKDTVCFSNAIKRDSLKILKSAVK